MTLRNERKLEILECVENEGEVTAEQLANILDLEIHNARMALKRYWKQGLLYRRIINKKTKARGYRISEKGLDKIEWLKGESELDIY